MITRILVPHRMINKNSLSIYNMQLTSCGSGRHGSRVYLAIRRMTLLLKLQTDRTIQSSSEHEFLLRIFS